jgi:hypothetical protein
MLNQSSLIDLSRAAGGTSASILPFNPPKCNCITDGACSSSVSQQNEPRLSDLEFVLETIDAVLDLLGDNTSRENGIEATSEPTDCNSLIASVLVALKPSRVCDP